MIKALRIFALATMIPIAAVSLTIFVSALCGCKTTDTGKVIATTATTVDAAMKGWAIHVHEGKATAEQERKVAAAWLRYKAIESAAVKAYAAAYKSRDKDAMAAITAGLQAAVADLHLIIATFKSGGTL
jgi:hypothetical protein